ncbi:MAG: metalloregulator ArsR/SmtB family transcription factor [Chloroflexi bacterium]|nr:metalloregulator ArsR/SmtB family transcription factor [Chloroflexota bacterium]
MGLFSIPPQIQIEFKQSLAHSLLIIIGLLHQADRVEGLGDWIQNTAGRMETQNKNIMNGIAALLLFANGVQGYLVEKLRGRAATEFSDMMDELEALDSEELQAVTLKSLTAWAKRFELRDESAPVAESFDDVLTLLDDIQQFKEQNGHLSRQPMSNPDLANLILDAETLHDHFMMAFEYVWHHFYASRWEEDRLLEQAAVAYHRTQHYPADLPVLFRSVTGRTLPSRLHDYMHHIHHVTMIPSVHIGAYVIVSILDDHMWIGFNANLVPVEKVEALPVGIAELYPVLKALADETRLKIVTFLRQEGEVNVTDIADTLHLTASTASRHLTLLARTGILDVRRDGTMRYYALNRETLGDIGERLVQLAVEPARID